LAEPTDIPELGDEYIMRGIERKIPSTADMRCLIYMGAGHVNASPDSLDILLKKKFGKDNVYSIYQQDRET
jgi:hypothetical protein